MAMPCYDSVKVNSMISVIKLVIKDIKEGEELTVRYTFYNI